MSSTPHTIFMLVRATSAWLALTPSQRFAFRDETIVPLLGAHPAVMLRFFDSEFYNARISDILMWETRDLAAFRSLVEALRETSFWNHFFKVVEIIPAIENGYVEHYGVEPIGQAA